MRFNEILEGTRADLAVKVFGADFAVIEKIAGEAREILEKIPGAADVASTRSARRRCWKSFPSARP
jgi:cobalt-zinc-cadmium resistance protein CzcA